MAGRDVDSVTRDMETFVKQAMGTLTRRKIEPDAESVTRLAVAMFNDYRNNTPRGAAEIEAREKTDLMRLERKLFGRKGRHRR